MSSRRRELSKLRRLADRYFYASPMSKPQVIAVLVMSTALIVTATMLCGILYSPYAAMGVAMTGILGYGAIIGRLTPDHPDLEKRFAFSAETYKAEDLMAYEAFMDVLFREGMKKEAVYRWLDREEMARRK